ncbi:MAG: hypothetical protein HQM04_06725 [Magnetococcales bacterium]|nr:hypothetical protein [Magnetococcales bacterium]MBF0114721.1 hypothetical protein [Magnetococcales bacterium]
MNDLSQDVLLALGRVEAKMDEISENQKETRADLKTLDERLRSVESRTYTISVVGGAGAAVVVGLATDYIKKAIGL